MLIRHRAARAAGSAADGVVCGRNRSGAAGDGTRCGGTIVRDMVGGERRVK